MTRSEQLQSGKLYECTSCGRMEYRPLDYIPVPCCGGDDCECEWEMELIAQPTKSQHFEAIAQTFHRETNCLRPGKDAPAVFGEDYLQRCREKWEEWNKRPIGVRPCERS